MNYPDDTIYLRHILDATGRVSRFLQGIDQDTFNRDELVQSAVNYQIQIVGEAVRHLSQDLRGRYPTIPWQDIAGMRSKLVHDYFGVSVRAVWISATRDLPILASEVQRILAQIEGH